MRLNDARRIPETRLVESGLLARTIRSFVVYRLEPRSWNIPRGLGHPAAVEPDDPFEASQRIVR